MSDEALIGSEQRLEVELEGQWVNVPFVSISRSRAIGEVPIDDTDDEGEANFRMGKSVSTGSLELRFRAGVASIRAIIDAAENKIRLPCRYFPIYAPGTDMPYWEGLMSFTSDETSGSINDDPLALNYSVTYNKMAQANQTDLTP